MICKSVPIVFYQWNYLTIETKNNGEDVNTRDWSNMYIWIPFKHLLQENIYKYFFHSNITWTFYWLMPCFCSMTKLLKKKIWTEWWAMQKSLVSYNIETDTDILSFLLRVKYHRGHRPFNNCINHYFLQQCLITITCKNCEWIILL
jgi:hypothetical protein